MLIIFVCVRLCEYFPLEEFRQAEGAAELTKNIYTRANGKENSASRMHISVYAYMREVIDETNTIARTMNLSVSFVACMCA